MNAPLVLSLDAESTPSAVGSKALNLARLYRAGLPVPPAFVLTTAAYDRFVQANGLAEAIAGRVAALEDGAPDALEALYATPLRGRKRFEALPNACPTDPQAEILSYEAIPADYIVGVYLAPGADPGGLHDHGGLSINFSPDLFAPRADYKLWQDDDNDEPEEVLLFRHRSPP